METENGEQALEIIQQTTINLLIADVHMPDMSGMELLKEIPNNVSDFYDNLLVLFKKKTMFSGLSIGILAWLVDAIAVYFCFIAFDLNFNFIETTLTNFAPMIVGTILFIPGGLGVLELGMTGLLLQSGVLISTATALVLFIRFMITWSSVMVGIIALKFAKFN